jgi:ABC-type polysaccharide/polyol phosphate transport system ATPase subunit
MTRPRQSRSLRPRGISVENLVLEYPLYRHIVLDRFRALVGSVLPDLKPPVRRVLDRISFSIEPGELVGIVGQNGAGKTSLLKVISGLVSPTEGRVFRDGRIMALLNMGVGFRATFTGRENLRYGGLLLGLEAREVEDLIPGVAEFSELGDALDQPYFTYSAGMRSRLAFSLATSVPADIVILDETLAAGDARFVSKCYRRLKEIHASGKTILFVSHNLGEVARLTSRVIVLEQGRVRFNGDVFEGLKIYEQSLVESTMDAAGPIALKDVDASLAVKDQEGHPLKVVELGQRIAIELRIASQQELGESFVFLRIITMESNQVYAYLSVDRWKILRETLHTRDSVFIGAGETVITWTLPYWIAGEGGYFIDAYVGPACEPDSPDISRGRFWRHAVRVISSYRNVYLKGANTAAEMPVESVSIRSPLRDLGSS